MSKIHIVIAATSYEGSDAVRAFEDQGDAERFAQKCRDHADKQPRVPELNAPDADWDAYQKRSKRWEQTHPAKPFIGRESYSVGTIRFFPKGTP